MKTPKISLLAAAFAVVGSLTFVACQSTDDQQGQTRKALVVTSSAPGTFPSYCPIFPVPAGTKDTFALSQAYPDTFDVDAPKPWMAIDFRKDYQKYMKAVLEYAMEGNMEVDFKVQDNPI